MDSSWLRGTMNFREMRNTGLTFVGKHRNLIKNPHLGVLTLALCSPVTSGSHAVFHVVKFAGVCLRVWQASSWCVCVCVCTLHQLMCNNSYHFPLCLGRHAGVTVHQRLGRLWERVGNAVTETLAQTSSVRRTKCIIFTAPTAAFVALKSKTRVFQTELYQNN